MKGKTDLETSNNPNRNSHEKNCSKTRLSMVKTGRFYMELFSLNEKIFQVLGLVNPVLELDHEDDDIFKLGRRFSDVFNTFVN